MNKWIGLLVILCIATKGVTQSVNYEEEQVPPYVLPGLWNSDRQPDSAAWLSEYRPPLLDLLAGEMFGHIPNMDMSISIGSPKCDEVILDDKVRMQEYPVSVRASEGVLLFHILIFSPVESNKPSPVFLGLNFVGNHTIFPNAQIGLTPNWIPERKKEKLIGHTATDASRGTMARRWPVEAIVARGYAVATVYCGEFDPDFDDGFSNAAHALTAAQRTESSWGTIAAWAWGLSRALDALEDISHIDASRVAVLGHSRLGKAALWAGASDDRFAMVISNNSGCGGAALSRRRFGEKVARINTSFPHWFSTSFKAYNDRESELPFDQHTLLATIAPRSLYVASATEDQWADPRGEYLSLVHAAEVYRLFHPANVLPLHSPRPDQPVLNGSLGYHLRTGPHDITLFDWNRYMDFADTRLKRVP